MSETNVIPNVLPFWLDPLGLFSASSLASPLLVSRKTKTIILYHPIRIKVKGFSMVNRMRAHHCILSFTLHGSFESDLECVASISSKPGLSSLWSSIGIIVLVGAFFLFNLLVVSIREQLIMNGLSLVMVSIQLVIYI